MKRFLPTPEALQLLFEGTQALADIEQVGMRIDKDYLDKALIDTARQIKECEEKMMADANFYYWRRRYGDRLNLGSAEQLSSVIFEDMEYKSKIRTKSGKRASASAKALEGINIPLVQLYLEAQHMRKGRDTFLVGIQRELVQHEDGLWYVHPTYHHNRVGSFRSAATSPNVQNQPNRLPLLNEMVRKAYVPRPGNQLIEVDFAQQEVRVGTCYHKDPTMVAYLSDPNSDMHRDVAMQAFCLRADQVTKAIRHVAKNAIVFPFFYGSYYAKCAENVWQMISGLKLNNSETTVYEHLAEHGITQLGRCQPKEEPLEGSFEGHLKKIDYHFWDERFPVYNQWKKDWIAAYHRDGGCQFYSGFIMTGPHQNNDITNYAIQCDSYQCLVKALILINKCLRKYKMRSRVIAQIHDCCLGDVPPNEKEDYIHIVREAMVKHVMKDWKWITVQLATEVELCPVDGSWYTKKAAVEKDGIWVAK